jgi:radical SAM superfamily enzyme YgiQ (UPF0313 family)
VLLVSANREHLPDPIFPLGLAYVAAAVRAAGHRVTVADLCFEREPLRALGERIVAFDPEIVGVSLRNVDNAAYPLTVDYLPRHREVIDTVRRATRAPVVLGGSGFSILPQQYLETLGADYGVVGEGEEAFVTLIEALAAGRTPSGIGGVLIRGETGSAAPAPRLTDWGQLRPARELFDYARYVRRGGMGNVQTKRGCVFRCRYCTYPLLEGNRFRAREAGAVVDEIEQLQRNYGPHPLFFVDSILNFPPRHVEAICEEILRRGLRVRFSCYATPVKLDRAQATLLARAGCEGVELGSDAAEDGQLGRLGKSFDAEAVRTASDACLAAGLRVCHTVIFGAPGETPDTVRRTCAALRALRATAVVAMTGVRVYPGTPLARDLVAAGAVREEDITLAPCFFIDPAVREFLPGFLLRQAREAGNWVLPGLKPPLEPLSQRAIRALGIAGPLWRLLRFPLVRAASRTKFRRPATSWGIPNVARRVL